MTTLGVRARCGAARLGSFSVVAVAVAAGLPATAQPAEQEEIIVTGSRVSRSGFDSPQPLTSIDAEQIENLGLVNVGEVVRTMPQNTPFFTETNVGIGNFNVGAQLANLRGLNPFFGTRTLTLIDTRRVIGTTEGGAVDLTLIPSMLVARTEVVTGGASAQYGSDAIAGVVNVILDRSLDGIKAQVDYGQTGEGDGGDTHASFAFGTPFAEDGRGHILVGAEYQHQDPIGPCSLSRDWCMEAWGTGTNAGFATNGQPNFVVGPNAKFPTTENGIISPCQEAICNPAIPGGLPALPAQQFNAAGDTLSAYNPGLYPGLFARFGGDGRLLGYDTSSVRPDVERYSLLGHVSYALSDRLEYFAEIAYASSDAENFPANGGLGPSTARIQPDNAFLSPAVRAALPFGGNLSRIFMPDVISALNTTDNETTRFVTGLEGDLGSEWTWDAYYQYGENENHQRLHHNLVGSLVGAPVQYNFLGWALDAVRSNPADPNSPIVCRATLQGNPLAAGCVPLNLFGVGNASPQALEYVYRTLKEDSEYEQDALGVNFRTTLSEGWAGPIEFATGLEWRNDQAATTHDLANTPWYSSFALTYGLDRGGEIDVLEAYGEVEVPMSEKLSTNFSARNTQNEATSSTGSIAGDHSFTSWKAAALYDPLEWLRFRTTVSHDVRAAGFRELFLPRVTVQAAPGGFPGPVSNPWNSGANDAFLSTTGGNPNLEPEEADTMTFGAVLSFENWRFSADWFEIDLSGAITAAPGSQALVNACFQSGGTGAVCEKVTGAGTADITAIDGAALNVAGFLTRGWDYEVGYNTMLSRGGSLNVRVIATYLYDLIVDTGLGPPPIDYRGQSGPVASFGGFNTSPDWQATSWITYARDRFTTTFETKYIGSGKLNVLWTEAAPGSAGATLANSVNDNSVDDRYYFGWSGSYDFGSSENRALQVFWAVNNLFDEEPPVAPGGNLYPTNPVFFDTIGQRYRAGVRVGF